MSTWANKLLARFREGVPLLQRVLGLQITVQYVQ